MPLPIDAVLGILSDNLEKRKGALPISGKKATAWSHGLHIPVGGETVLYTGQMYQLTPAISSMAGQMARLSDSRITKLMKMGRVFNRIINLSWFMSHSDRKEQAVYNGVLRNVAYLLRTANVEFGYLYNKDLYTGALLYDQGVDDVFIEHAVRVYRILKEHGVKRLITVEPHTTNMFRSVYPSIIKDYDLDVKNYLEVLAESNFKTAAAIEQDLVIHDSCIYARHEGVISEPRKLLANVGAGIHEPECSSRFTHCCGGPLESLFPAKSHEIAEKRIDQLTAGGCTQIVTMCPICMAALKRAGGPQIQIKDISEYLYMACPVDNQVNVN